MNNCIMFNILKFYDARACLHHSLSTQKKKKCELFYANVILYGINKYKFCISPKEEIVSKKYWFWCTFCLQYNLFYNYYYSD